MKMVLNRENTECTVRRDMFLRRKLYSLFKTELKLSIFGEEMIAVATVINLYPFQITIILWIILKEIKN